MNKMSKMKKLALTLVTVLTVMNLAACAGSQTEKSEAVETQTAEEQVTVETEGVSSEEILTEENSSEDISSNEEITYPLTVTDSNGEEVELAQEPQKVVSVAPNLTEMMYALGIGDRLVGRSDYCDYPSEAVDIQSVGTISSPDIEMIISLEPDVVIVSTHFDEENTKKLEELQIPVLTLYEEKDVTGVYDMITTLGQAMNCVEQAQTLVRDMQDTIAEVEEKVAGLETPSVYYVVGYGEYGDYTAGGDTFVGGMLTMAGGDNIAKDVSGWSITHEELIEADPSIIIISEYMKSDFMSMENYSELTAVKEGNVYTLDTNMLDRQGYRNAEGIKALAEIFHPEVFE